jgi:hypothetical protein
MDIQRAAHGDDAILGEKFPQENRKKQKSDMLDQQENESDSHYRIRSYITQKQLAMAPKEKDDKWHDMNPEGFWEMAFTVRGIIYQPQFKDVLQSILDGVKKICKVVSQGLLASDPMYIGKVIYMMRHPRQVAKSQERLVRGWNYTDKETGEVKNALEDFKIHTPEMYIQVTVQASKFFLENADIPVLFLDFDDLIEDPETTIDKMQGFVGSGDYSKSYGLVQKKLKRSLPEDIEHRLWEDAEFVYHKFYKAADIINSGGDREDANQCYRDILQYFLDPKRAFNREKMNWKCFRAKRIVNESLCRQCIESRDVRKNFKTYSEETESASGSTNHWSQEPCVFECGLDFDKEESEYLTIEQSIANNFWSNDDTDG